MRSVLIRLWAGSMLALAALPARASLFSGETLDKVADILTIVVLVLVPVVGVVVFWLVHILPEKFAHKRHHPQRDAIQVLCLLSLVFGGLLWPLAWLWAFTKPVGYRMAYGTDKHEDYYNEQADRHEAGTLTEEEKRLLAADLSAMERSGALSPGLRLLRERLVGEAATREAEERKAA